MLRQSKHDRFLIVRDRVLYYWRRVPKAVSKFDTRGPIVRQSLRTDDVLSARAKRDILEKADNELWAAMLLNGERSARAIESYKAAKRLSETLGFSYRPADELARRPIEEIVERVAAIMSNGTPAVVSTAVMGGEQVPKVKVSEAFEIYCNEIVADEIAGKSSAQRKQWEKVKRRAINSFIAVVEDKAMTEITRDDGRAFHKHWLEKVAPKNGGPRKSASMGNRMVGNMRVLYDAYFTHLGDLDRQNPFKGLSFAEKFKKSRPPFPLDWIKTNVLRPGALAAMNDQARAIILTLIETGARPSEICNLTEPFIRLEAPVPHILIEPRLDPDDPREIKTTTSVRAVPLIGMALAAMRKFSKGFPRYKDKEASMSSALNKFFRENELFPTLNHKIYSFRHTFEDRLKEAGIDDELRRLLMGHAIDRPKYGSGGSLEWRRAELRKIELAFDLSIV
jgi:integrase